MQKTRGNLHSEVIPTWRVWQAHDLVKVTQGQPGYNESLRAEFVQIKENLSQGFLIYYLFDHSNRRRKKSEVFSASFYIFKLILDKSTYVQLYKTFLRQNRQKFVCSHCNKTDVTTEPNVTNFSILPLLIVDLVISIFQASGDILLQLE